jgi:glycosyltransferase involved in cell wall biosynthesis
MHPPQDPLFAQLERKAAECQAPLVAVPDRGPLDVSVYRRLLQICRENQVTIWHAHDYKSNLLGLLVRRRWPMHLVTTVHGWVKFTSRTPLYYWIDRRCLRRYDRVICVSEDLLQSCIDSGVPADRCVLVENAIDIDQYRRKLGTDAAKTALGFPPDRVLIGAVGRLSAEKGFDQLISAVADLVSSGRNVQLVIVGEGDQRQQLEAQIADQPDRSRFQLLGYRPDMRELYQAIDVFALSSLREGLPNVVLEAMAMEVPVVASRVAGVPNLIQHEKNGVLFDVGDRTELTRLLGMLVDQSALRERLAEAARRTIQTRYSFSVRMQRIGGIYGDLVESKGDS